MPGMRMSRRTRSNGSASDRAEGGGAVLDRGDLVAGPAEALLEDPAQAVLVVGDQDASVGHGVSRAHRAMGRKQVTAVPRPGSLLDLDGAAMLLEDPVADGQAEAEALVLGGEERGRRAGRARPPGCPSPSSTT